VCVWVWVGGGHLFGRAVWLVYIYIYVYVWNYINILEVGR